MAVDVSEFDTIEEVDKAYKKALAKADEADEPAIRAEWAEGKVAFYQLRESKAQLEIAKRDAVEKYPSAKRFIAQITGKTPAEVEASAKSFHDAIEEERKTFEQTKQQAADDEATARAQAQQQYGAPVGAGGGTPIPPLLEPHEALERRIHQRLTDGKGLQDSQSKMDVARWVPDRLRAGIVQSQQNPSYKSTRPGTADDKKISDDRTARKNAR